MLLQAFVNLRKSILNLLSLADKLKSSSLATSDYWKTLKSFIKPSVDTSIPPIFHNGSYISDSSDKAKLLNDFFVSQISFDNSTATLPNTDLPTNNTFHNIIITVEEVRPVLQTIKMGESSGPDNINNRILKEIAYPIFKPYCDLFS